MILIQFGFSKPNAKRGKLFGEHDRYQLIVLDCLLFRMVIPVGESVPLFRQALSGLMRDDDWFVKNAPSVRRERAKARAKVFRENKLRQDDMVKDWRDNYHETNDKLQKEIQRRRELETALKVMQRLSA